MDAILTTIILLGLITASLQDLKRREVDNWLNLSILLLSTSYIAYTNNNLIPELALSITIMYTLAHVFYYTKIFAGGDAKLLIAISPLFTLTTTNNITGIINNIGLFTILLLTIGSLYGLTWSIILYNKNKKEINKNIKEKTQKIRKTYNLTIIITLLAISYLNTQLLIPTTIILLLPYLYLLAKELENTSMTKKIMIKNLRPGDWLAQDITIKNKKIKATWQGITKKELKYLQKHKNKTTKILIKEGIPFVPAILLTYIAYLVTNKNLTYILHTLLTSL